MTQGEMIAAMREELDRLTRVVALLETDGAGTSERSCRSGTRKAAGRQRSPETRQRIAEAQRKR